MSTTSQHEESVVFYPSYSKCLDCGKYHHRIALDFTQLALSKYLLKREDSMIAKSIIKSNGMDKIHKFHFSFGSFMCGHCNRELYAKLSIII
jgi:hypothetical protein